MTYLRIKDYCIKWKGQPTIQRRSWKSPRIQLNRKQIPPDISLPYTKSNLVHLSILFNVLFIQRGGLDYRQEDDKFISLNVAKKYQSLKGEYDNNMVYQNIENKTRGWCYLAVGTLHRFFWKDTDLYRSKCQLIKTDYHYWLQDKKNNVIDLTEDQYHKNGIMNPRNNGKKVGPMGYSYGRKTRNMACLIQAVLYKTKVNPNVSFSKLNDYPITEYRK